MSSTPNYAGNFQPIVAQILPADTTAKKTICAAGGSGPRKITALSVASTDTSARVLNFYVTSGGVDYLVCAINIPIGSGNTNAVPPVNILASANWTWFEYDAAGNKVCVLPTSGVLKAASDGTVTTAKELDFVGNAQDLT